MNRSDKHSNSQTRREPPGELLEEKRGSATHQATGKSSTTQSRKEPQGEFLENGSSHRSPKQTTASKSTTHARRNPQGELLEEGHRQQALAHHRGSSSSRAKTVSVQKGASPNPSNVQATPFTELKARLSNHEQPTAKNYPQIRSEIQSNLQGSSRLPSDTSSIASSSAMAHIQKQLLANRRSEDMISFFGRLSNVIQLLANEGVPFELPCIVLDHVAIHDLHLKHIILLVRRIASKGQQMIDDGIQLFKVKEVSVSDTRNRTEPAKKMWMIIINLPEIKANHAIFKKFNQTRAYQMMINAYAFDLQGCKYPDETITRTPLNVRNMRVRVRQTPNPVFIDFKDSYRQPGRDRERKQLERPVQVFHLIYTEGTSFYQSFFQVDRLHLSVSVTHHT